MINSQSVLHLAPFKARTRDGVCAGMGERQGLEKLVVEAKGVSSEGACEECDGECVCIGKECVYECVVCRCGYVGQDVDVLREDVWKGKRLWVVRRIRGV